MLINKRVSIGLFSLISIVLLTACGGSGNNTDTTEPGADDDGLTRKIIDATAGGFGTPATDPANKYTYFNFDTGEVVDISDADSETSNAWHIAFKRTSFKLNSGVSGGGSTTGGVADAQENFYNTDNTANASVFLNATADGELNAIYDVTDASGVTFKADENLPYIAGDGSTESWWLYNPMNHSVSANADAWNILRGADGNSFAKVHVTDIVQLSRDITVELFIQDSTASAFSLTPTTWTAAIGDAGGAKCYDFDTAAEVDCLAEAANWDMQLEVSADGRSWYMWTNGGIKGEGSSGASFGVISPAQADTYVSGAGVPGFFADAASSVFIDSSWYAYNLQGGHRLWPNYRVYIIDTGTTQYKLQITSYYDESGTSGMISLRYAVLP